MVFNTPMSKPESDAQIIDRLGGPVAVAKLLNYTNRGAAARVSNWKRRGIPADVLVEFPHLFAAALSRRAAVKSSQAGGKAATPQVGG